MEKRGIPTIAVVGKGFEKAARSFGRAYKLPELRLLLVDDTVAHQGGDELLQLAVGGVDQVVEEWGKGAGDTNRVDHYHQIQWIGNPSGMVIQFR